METRLDGSMVWVGQRSRRVHDRPAVRRLPDFELNVASWRLIPTVTGVVVAWGCRLTRGASDPHVHLPDLRSATAKKHPGFGPTTSSRRLL